jgi:hypothetical protein
MLASPRLRRRLLKVSVLVVALGAVAAAFVLWPNTADQGKYDSPLSNEPAVVPREPASVALSGAARAQALATARRFLRTAVVREHVAESFDLVHPDLRQGLTRKQWSTGEIPVTPYPVDAARWKLGYSQRDAVGLEVYLLPKAGTKVRAMVFDLQLKAAGSGQSRRWLVSSWAPRGGTAFAEPPVSPEREAAAREAQRRWDAVRLPLGWLLLPFGVLAAALSVPVFLGLRDRRRRGVAEKRFREHREQRLAARRGGDSEKQSS